MKKGLLCSLLGILLLVVVSLVGLWFRNRNLPTESTVVEYLSDGDKTRLEEFYHLQSTLGNDVWPGWGDAKIPVIIYNEQYVFLVNYPENPPDGWLKMPSGELRGTVWEVVLDDHFSGQPYYRQPLNPDKTPENFTVKVGDHWVPTLQTYEYAAIEFYKGFSQDLPGVISGFFPYRFFWRLLMPNSETYAAAIAHESFHAVQGNVALDRMSAAEESIKVEDWYDWDDEALTTMWQEEMDLLYEAVMEDDIELKKELTAQFLAKRVERRTQFSLSLDEIEFERQREWLEGMAKYAELSLQFAAAQNDAYQPTDAILDDAEFDQYRKTEKYFSRQVSEVTRMAKQDGEIRFYYTGMCMGLLLDDLSPGWKEDFLTGKSDLEQLLEVAIQ